MPAAGEIFENVDFPKNLIFSKFFCCSEKKMPAAGEIFETIDFYYVNMFANTLLILYICFKP